MKKSSILIALIVVVAAVAVVLVISSNNSKTAISGNFNLIDASQISLEKYQGKVVVIDFWASWCHPCRQQMPVIEEFYKRLPKTDCVELIAVNLGESVSKVNDFLSKHPVPYQVAVDPTGRFGSKFGVTALPTIVVIGRDGKVIDLIRGFSPSVDTYLESTIRNVAPECVPSA